LGQAEIATNEDFNKLFAGVYEKISDKVIILIDGLENKKVIEKEIYSLFFQILMITNF
jgi:hypothetical protein